MLPESQRYHTTHIPIRLHGHKATLLVHHLYSPKLSKELTGGAEYPGGGTDTPGIGGTPEKTTQAEKGSKSAFPTSIHLSELGKICNLIVGKKFLPFNWETYRLQWITFPIAILKYCTPQNTYLLQDQNVKYQVLFSPGGAMPGGGIPGGGML